MRKSRRSSIMLRNWELMLATGLRVGDAVGFDRRALSKGESLWIYTYQPQKQKRSEKPKLLEAYITDEMKKRIDECKWLSIKGPFWYGAGSDPTPLAQAVYERMQNIGARAGNRGLSSASAPGYIRGPRAASGHATRRRFAFAWAREREGDRNVLRERIGVASEGWNGWSQNP